MKKICSFFLVVSSLFFYLHGHEAQTIYQYFWANYHQFAGDMSKAATWYTDLFSRQVSPYCYKGYLYFLSDVGDIPRMKHLMDNLKETFNRDPDIQLLLATALEKNGEQQQADEKIVALAQQFKTHQEIIFYAAQVYVRRKEPENALKAIDDFLNNSVRKPNNFIFLFLKAQINTQLNHNEEALKNISACLEMHPYFDKGWLLFAALEEQRNNLDEAIKGYKHFLEIAGKNPDIERRLLQLMFKQKMTQASSPYKGNISCFDQALMLFDKKEYAKALTHIAQCLQKNPDDQESRILKIQIMSAMGNQAGAANELKSWIDKDPNNNLWYSTLHLLCHCGLTHQKAQAVLEDLEQQHPDTLLPVLYLADIHMRLQNHSVALNYHKKALSVTHDHELKAQILYHMGRLHYDLAQYEDMKRVLEEGLTLSSISMPLNMLLAYYYAARGNDLVKAQQLIDTVLKNAPDDPNALDIQALILYKQKNYQQACMLFEKAVHRAPDNTTIQRHLGKTYYKMGNITKAQEIIKQAVNTAACDREKNKCSALLHGWMHKP